MGWVYAPKPRVCRQGMARVCSLASHYLMQKQCQQQLLDRHYGFKVYCPGRKP